MASLFSRRTPLVAAAALLSLLSLPAAAAPDGTNGCFDARVDYLGRTPVANINGVQYYRWNYRITGVNCVSRKMAFWTLGLCTQTQSSVSQISLDSGDDSDMPDGTMTHYKFKVGKDPITTLSGLKWDFQTGNQLDKVGECDDFSFVATGSVTPIPWGAKAGGVVVMGTTLGPTCAPVPVEIHSWSGVKAMFRS